MTLQLLHSEFPCILGKFDFLFYQCSIWAEYESSMKWVGQKQESALGRGVCQEQKTYRTEFFQEHEPARNASRRGTGVDYMYDCDSARNMSLPEIWVCQEYESARNRSLQGTGIYQEQETVKKSVRNWKMRRARVWIWQLGFGNWIVLPLANTEWCKGGCVRFVVFVSCLISQSFCLSFSPFTCDH